MFTSALGETFPVAHLQLLSTTMRIDLDNCEGSPVENSAPMLYTRSAVVKIILAGQNRNYHNKCQGLGWNR